jgi:hypothetical protein
MSSVISTLPISPCFEPDYNAVKRELSSANVGVIVKKLLKHVDSVRERKTPSPFRARIRAHVDESLCKKILEHPAGWDAGTKFYDHVLDTSSSQLLQRRWWLIRRFVGVPGQKLTWKLKKIVDSGVPGFVCWEETTYEKDIVRDLHEAKVLSPETKSLPEALVTGQLLSVANFTTMRYTNGLCDLDFSCGQSAPPKEQQPKELATKSVWDLLRVDQYVLATICLNVKDVTSGDSLTPEGAAEAFFRQDTHLTFGNTLRHVWLQNPAIISEHLGMDLTESDHEVHWKQSSSDYFLYKQFLQEPFEEADDDDESSVQSEEEWIWICSKIKAC